MSSTIKLICICHVALDYRSHTIRMKRWLPEIEQKIKYAFNVLKNENEAVQFLLNLGLTTHEIDLVLQHFLTNAELNMRKKEQFQNMDHQARNPLSAQEQQLELIGFSQRVSGFSPSFHFLISAHLLFLENNDHIECIAIKFY